MNLWQELRQRRVVKVAAIYAAVAWGLTEVLNFLIDSFPFVPDRTSTVVALIFVLGFPVSVFLAWIFDVGPDGRIRATPGSVHGVFAIGASIVLLTAGTTGLFFLIYPGSPPTPQPASPTTTAPGLNAVAVLPFASVGAETIDEYFVDGLTDELITLLTQVQTLKVAARSSAFEFRGRTKSIGEIRRDLGVGTVLEGTVRIVGDRLRITAQLVDTATGYQLWAQSFQVIEQDVFKVQAEIARAVVATLDPGSADLLRESGGNAQAHKLYLQAKHLADNRRDESGLREALEIFEAATAIDPAFAPAHIGIAELWIALADNAYVPAETGYARAREIAEHALSLDQDLARAHFVLGWVELNHEWNWPRAERFLRDALLLQPGNAAILGANAALDQVLGRFERAVELASQVAERDPLRPGAHTNLAYFAYTAGQFDLCEEAIGKAIALNPEYPGAHLTLAQAWLAQGDLEAAVGEVERERHPLLKAIGRALVAHDGGDAAAVRRAIETLENEYADAGAYQIANVYAYLNERDQAIAWLERAFRVRDPGLPQLRSDPLMANLHDDPRYQAMLDRLNLQPGT